MAIATIQLTSNNSLPQAVLSRVGFKKQEHLKAILGKMGILLVNESASLSDIILTLEELKSNYASELRELDREWNDFILSEEWLASDI